MIRSRSVIIYLELFWKIIGVTLHLILVGVSVHLPVSEDQSPGHQRPAAAEGARSDEYLKCSINYESVYFSVYLCKSMPQFQFYISSPSLITESVVLN